MSDHQDNPAIDAYDEMVNPRCPRLGQEITFRYCRNENQGLPCRKIVFCWGHRFDVLGHLRVHFDADVIESLGEPPPDKRRSLADLIKRARKANELDGG